MDHSQQSRQLDARRHQNDINEQRRINHLPVAIALRDPLQAPSILSAANVQIKKWREHALCSKDYIDAWEALLQDPQLAAKVLEDTSVNAMRLRQNSPFVASVKKFKRS